MKIPVLIRPVRITDLPRLVEIEENNFDTDKLSRRNFHWLIKHAHSIFLGIFEQSRLIGYGIVLYNKGTSLARLYSIVVDKEFQGLGYAKKLISELERKAAEDEECSYLRLEVREDNDHAIKLYENLGFKKFTEKTDYYEDGATAFCFEKRIRFMKGSPRQKIPYFPQGTEFTCGPASLMMAMSGFRSSSELSLSHELQIWREATTIFMTSGHGGCGPHGLALSAWRRGFRVQIFLTRNEVLFLNTVRSQEKKRVVELVQHDFEKKIKEAQIEIVKKRFSLRDLREALEKGGIPILLITTYHFDNSRAPHWVVVTAFDDHFVYIHDPDLHHANEHVGLVNRVHVPIPKDQFLKISRWGKDRLSAAVVLFNY